MEAIKRTIHYLLIEEMDAGIEGVPEDDPALRLHLERKLTELLGQETTPLSAEEKRSIIDDAIDNVLGYGPLETLLSDPTVTEVMANGPYRIYVERAGKVYDTGRRFVDEAHMLRTIGAFLSRVGQHVDRSQPMAEARLPDGSRVNAVVAPLAVDGPLLTVRKFSHDSFTAEDLVAFGTMDERVAAFLRACVRGRLNMLISGGSGTGKTTLLNVVSGFVPQDERVITIEDTAELRLSQEHVLRLEARPRDVRGAGEVNVGDLVHTSLRMRPDRIIVGEVCGGEALDMLRAMNTGHDGMLATVHADSPRDALSRLETMVLMSGVDAPACVAREQVARAIDVLVHLARLRDGTRRVVQICEVEGMEGDGVALRDLFHFDHSSGMDETGRFRGRIKSTGLRPTFVRRLTDLGVSVAPETFEYEPPTRR